MTKFSTKNMSKSNRETNNLFEFQQSFCLFNSTQPNKTKQDQMTSQQDFLSKKNKKTTAKHCGTLHIAPWGKKYKSDMGIG